MTPVACDGRSSKPLAFLVITDTLKKATFTAKWPPPMKVEACRMECNGATGMCVPKFPGKRRRRTGDTPTLDQHSLFC